MAKKFVDLNNLKILWNEINEKFLRTSQVEEFTDLITPDILSSSPEIQLRPNREWENVDEDFYNKFISFVNTQHNTQLVIDADGYYWDVINKTFYDRSIKKYTGLILSINEEPLDIDKDTELEEVKNNFERFWYIKINRNIDGSGHYIYSLKWYPFSIPWGNYIETRITENKFNDQLEIYNNRLLTTETNINSNSNKINSNVNYINNLMARVEALEKELNIVSGMLVSTSEFTITPTDQAGRLLNGCSILEIKSVTGENDNEEGQYPIYDGNINDIVLYEYVGNQIKVKLTGEYAIKITIKRDKYDNYELFIPHDSQEKNIKIIFKPETVSEDSLEDKIYNKYPIQVKFAVNPSEAANSNNNKFDSLVKTIYQYGYKTGSNGTKGEIDKTSKYRIYNSTKLTGLTSELSTSYSNKLLITCPGMKDIELDLNKNYYGEYSSNNPYIIQTTDPTTGNTNDYIEFKYDSIANDYILQTYVFDEYGRVCNYSLTQYDYDGKHGNATASSVDGKCTLSLSKGRSSVIKVKKNNVGSEYYNDTYYICPKTNQGLTNIQLQKKQDYNKVVLICNISIENRTPGLDSYRSALQYFIDHTKLVRGTEIYQLDDDELIYEKNYTVSKDSATLIYTVYNAVDIDDLGGVYIIYEDSNTQNRFEAYQSNVVITSGEHTINITAKMKEPYANSTLDPNMNTTTTTTQIDSSEDSSDVTGEGDNTII